MNRRPDAISRPWRVAWFLFAAGALNYADRSALSSVIPPLRRDLGITDVDIGIMGSLFLWSYALASPIAGNLADRFSRSTIIGVSLAAWSLITLATGFAPNVKVLFGLRVALGVVESFYLPAAAALLGDHHGPATRGRALGLHMTGMTFGAVVGGSFAGALAEHHGWRWGFWILGGGGLLWAVGSRLALADRPLRPAQHATAAPPAVVRETLAYLLRVPTFHIMLFSTMMVGVASWIFFTWLPLYFRENYGLHLGEAGLIGMAVFQGPSLIGIVLGGWLSDRAAVRGAQNRALLKALSFLLSAPLLLVLLGTPSLAFVVASLSVSSLIRTMGGANEHPIICDVVPARFRSTAFGILNMCGTAAGGVGVLASSLLKGRFGLPAIFGGLAFLFVPAALAVLFCYYRLLAPDAARAQAYPSAAPDPPINQSSGKY